MACSVFDASKITEPGTHARPLASAEGLHGSLVDDDDFFAGMLVRRMRLLARFERRGVNFELIQCCGGRAKELAGLADVGLVTGMEFQL